jgi:hypothetical protein
MHISQHFCERTGIGDNTLRSLDVPMTIPFSPTCMLPVGRECAGFFPFPAERTLEQYSANFIDFGRESKFLAKGS